MSSNLVKALPTKLLPTAPSPPRLFYVTEENKNYIFFSSQVAERTRLLTEEKKKTDALLYSMLPRYLANSLWILKILAT